MAEPLHLTDEDLESDKVAELFGEYSRLETEKRRLDQELKSVQEKQSMISPMIMKYFEYNGVSKFTTEDFNVHLTSRNILNTTGSRAEIRDALLSAGSQWNYIVNFNSVSLASALRQCDEADEPVPPGIAAVVGVDKHYYVKCKKG